MKYHIFIAYSSEDRAYAKSFYDILGDDYEVFYDYECLLPGDPWDIYLPNAQENSLITLVLISNSCDRSYYHKEEIQTAISLAEKRGKNHRIIPIYLNTEFDEANIPYGLKRLHAIVINEKYTILNACKKIIKVLRKMPYNDISKESKEELTERRIDNLQNLYDKREKFIQKIKDIDKKSNAYFRSILHIDIDGFTGINQRYGIAVGNTIVQKLTETIDLFSEKHPYVRWGGDSFFVYILRNNKVARNIGEEIRNEISTFNWETISPRLYVTISVGVATQVGKDDFPFGLIDRAKEGTRFSKKNGGNKVMEGPKFAHSQSKIIYTTEFVKQFDDSDILP